MSRLTLALAAQITSQRHRDLISYTRDWYHIVVLGIPIYLLCGRPFGKHPVRWQTPSVLQDEKYPQSRGVWLCDECWARYAAEQNMPRHQALNQKLPSTKSHQN